MGQMKMKFLIVDDESDITELIEFLIIDFFSSETQTILASSGNEAIKILGENPDIDVCICDHNMPDGMGTDVLKYIVNSNSKTKFVLCSTVIPSDKPLEYPRSFIFFNIQKPDIGNGIDNLFRLIETHFPNNLKIKKDEFIPITIHFLSLLGKVPADIYIRMSDNKFIKCINQSEVFSAEDKEKYEQKFIENLYIKKNEQCIHFNKVILDAVSEIMERRNLPLSEKMSMAHSQLVGLIKFTGATPELMDVAQKNIQQTVNFIVSAPLACDFWKKINLLGEYPSRLYTLHSMLASVVVKKLHWSSEATIYKLTLAAFLQDISLDSIPLIEICDYREFTEKKGKFTSAEVKKFNEHPFKAVEILNSFRDIPPDIDRILIEQHEMPDGSGIPKKLNSNQLGPLSCVFILTGIFARHVLKEKNAFDLPKFVTYLELRGYSRGNFKEGFEAIRDMKSIR